MSITSLSFNNGSKLVSNVKTTLKANTSHKEVIEMLAFPTKKPEVKFNTKTMPYELESLHAVREGRKPMFE
jgi:hypothetical protein